MAIRHIPRRALTRVFAACIACASVGAPHHAWADAIDPCVSVASAGQQLQRAGRLKDARSKFLGCVRPECPSEVKAVCDRLLSSVEASTPTVIFGARAADGQDLVHVRVLVDQAALVESLDGRAVPLDPGPHALRFEHIGEPPVLLQLVIREAEKNRLLTVDFPGVDRSSSAQPAVRPTPVVVYVLEAAGVVSLAGFGFLAIHGQSQYSDCNPHNCSQSMVDALTAERYLAFAALGIGVASLGAATWLWLTRPAHASPSISLGASAVPGGGGFWATGAF